MERRCPYLYTGSKFRVNGSQLAKMEKSTFLTCHYHEIYREEAAGLKKINYIFKILIFFEYVKFGVIALKIYIL